MEDRLFQDPALVRFYDAENRWGDDTRFCLAFAHGRRSVLDLGCGTGLLAAALGATHEVWGVDPAAAMLAVARNRDGGRRVTWVEGDGRTVRLGRRFDLVLLTGHAFQCLLTDDDQAALSRTIAAHLQPGGAFVFDSRNPAAAEWRTWTPEESRRLVVHPDLGEVTAWNDVAFDAATGVVAYRTVYESDGGGFWEATSRIRFADRHAIATRLAEAGLAVDRWLGDWSGTPWTPQSPEIIPIGRLA
jgi:SAM-dependent methyltransferase